MEKVWKIEEWKIGRGGLERVGSCWNGRWRQGKQYARCETKEADRRKIKREAIKLVV
jgi:hypothetical protein